MRHLVLLLLPLAACGPMPPGQAADICEERARGAAGPRGEAYMGVTSTGGAATGAKISISSDYLLGRDPQLVYETCVRDLTGQGPVRPLVLR